MPNSLALTVGFLAILGLSRRIVVNNDVQKLPGPSSNIASWIWGHELLVFQHAAAQMFSVWARSFGDMFKIKGALFHPDIVIATDHAAIQHIFANNELCVKSPAFRPPIENMLGVGLVWAEGEDWHLQRRMLSPAFSPDAVREMTPAIYEWAERLRTRLANLILGGESCSSSNLVPYISACTLDIIGIVGLWHSFSAQSGARSDDDQSDATQIRTSWGNFVNAGLQPLAFLAPLVVRAFPAIARAPLPAMQRQGVAKLIVRRLGRRMLDLGEGSLTQGKDIISILLRARRAGTAAPSLSDDQILDNIVTFAMAGHETTASTLTFTLWELARQPAIQDRLRTEILSYGPDLSYDDIQKLEFLDAVVKEGLRLYPAAPQTERVTLQDDIIPLATPVAGIGSTLRVCKGQVICIPFTTINTNPSVWGPTADVFDPTRWLDARRTDPATLPHGWSGLLSFCDGSRNCIGWRLAILELKIILSTLIRSIVFEDTGARVEGKISPTLQAVVDGKGGNLPLSLQLV